MHTTLRSLVSLFTLGLCACSAERSLETHTSQPQSLSGEPESAPAAAPADDAQPEPAIVSTPPAVRWRDCGSVNERNVRCAEVDVPLDYAEPDGEQLPIAVNLLEASPTEHHRGVLFFNPGGPGGSGTETMLALAKEGYFDRLAPGFDIVGFDPRGVAGSGERACGKPLSQTLPYGRSHSGGVAGEISNMRAQNRDCARAWGPLFEQLGSNQVVRDMDRLRQALGEPKFNFLGGSYGTRLGALYAHAFPETAGQIVLDAVVPPSVDMVQDARDGLAETLALQEAFFQDCESGTLPCPSEPRRAFDELLAAAGQLGVAAQLVSLWLDALSAPPGRDGMVTLLQRQRSAPDSSWLLDVLQSNGDSDIATIPLITVNCIDATSEPPSDTELEALYSEFSQQSAVFGDSAFFNAAACAAWPVQRDPVPLPTATDAPPLLVIGGTQDWRTPFSGAEAMVSALGNATLLTSKHFGHGATRWGSTCVSDAVRSFFVDGALPAADTVCE